MERHDNTLPWQQPAQSRTGISVCCQQYSDVPEAHPLQLSLLGAEQGLGVAQRLHKGGDLGILLLQACAAACSMHILSWQLCMVGYRPEVILACWSYTLALLACSQHWHPV